MSRSRILTEVRTRLPRFLVFFIAENEGAIFWLRMGSGGDVSGMDESWSEGETLRRRGEILYDEADVIEGKFHKNESLFLESTAASGRSLRAKVWALREGEVGSSNGCAIQLPKVEGCSDVIGRIQWIGEHDEYDLHVNAENSRGSFLLLSCTRACRETIALEEGDMIFLAKDKKKLLAIRNANKTSTIVPKPIKMATSGLLQPSKRYVTSMKEPEICSQEESLVIPSARASNSSVSMEDYIQIKVSKLAPSRRERRAARARNRRNVIQRAESSTRRRLSELKAGKSGSLRSLRADALRSRFDEVFGSSKDGQVNSGLRKIIGEEENESSEKKVTIQAELIMADASRALIEQNVFGGSTVLDEEQMLDAVLCDDIVDQEHLKLLQSSTRRLGVPIASSKIEEMPDKLVSSHKETSDSLHTSNFNGKASMIAELDACELCLEIVGGLPRLEGSHFQFGVQDVSIGSHRTNVLQIEELSNFHVRIERDSENRFWLRDLAIGNPLGTLFQLGPERPVTIQKGDVLRFGKNFEVTVKSHEENPEFFTEIWDDLALRIIKTRRSYRYRQVSSSELPLYVEKFFIMSGKDEIAIGRRAQQCDVVVKDYEMPACAASVLRFDNNFFVSAALESRKKGVFLELSDRRKSINTLLGKSRESIGKIRLLEKGDAFRIGRTQMVVLLKRKEPLKEIEKARSKALEQLCKVRLFAGLNQSELTDLARCASKMEFEAGEMILKQGRKVTGIILLVSGSAEVYHEHDPGKILNIVSSKVILGEMSLFTGFPATASVRALEKLSCLYIDYHMARAFIHPTNFEMMKLLVEHRLTQALVHDIRNIPGFQGSRRQVLQLLARRMFRVVVDKASRLFDAEVDHDSVYIVSTGSAFVSKNTPKRPTKSFRPMTKRSSLKQVSGGGHIFGEAFLSIQNGESTFKTPYAVFAEGHTVLYGLKRKDYERVTEMSIEEQEEEFQMTKFKFFDVLNQRNEQLTTSSEVESAGFYNAKRRGSFMDLHEQTTRAKNTEGKSSGPSSTKVIPMETEPDALGPIKQSGPVSPIAVSTGEGEEGHALALLSKNMSSQDFSKIDNMSILDESTKTDDDLQSIVSESTIDELESFIHDVDDLCDEVVVTRTRNEMQLHGRPIGEVERDLDREFPFYLVLKCVAGPQKKQIFILTETISMFGRWTKTVEEQSAEPPYPGCRFVSLNDRNVSRVNSMIQYRDGDFFLNDLGSKHGTHLKLHANMDYKLTTGDVISCSQHEFQIYAKRRLQKRRTDVSCCSLQ